MSDQGNSHLADLLAHTRQDTLAALKDIDLEQVIHPDSGWRVRDVVAHLIAWDIAAVQAMQHLQNGTTDAIPDYSDMDSYNAGEVNKRKGRPIEELFAEWAKLHEEFKALVENMSDDLMGTRFRFPWGATGTGYYLVEVMAGHEQYHREEIQLSI
jgi:hypothetical protein